MHTPTAGPAMLARRFVMWLMLAVLAALLSYVGFRGYMTPDMLFNFANAFHC